MGHHLEEMELSAKELQMVNMLLKCPNSAGQFMESKRSRKTKVKACQIIKDNSFLSYKDPISHLK